MTARLALGTYRCRNIPEAAARAVASGAEWIDTAPNYGTGRAQSQLAGTLAAHPSVHVSTKVGYFTASTGGAAVNAGVLTPEEATAGHSLAPEYVRWQIRRNCLELRRDRLDVVLLHNPERAHPGDRSALYRSIRDAFTVLEEEVAAGRVGGYGVATWHGFEEGAFSVPLLLALAAEAAGGQQHHHLAAVQLPVSLVMMSPIEQVLDGRGPIRDAATAGLRVMASAPLHGGELLAMVDQELVDLIRPGLTPAQACILAAASCPGVTQVLMAASSAPHWKEAADVVAQPPLDIARLREITGVLSSA
ncbi:aldo/keto reductase [Streptomyces sp. RLB3-6]|uniref:aldo/keto reductase n=1 Tax=Streptomyces sp. RLB3-6 TaxID=2594457 RepID=UPI00116493F6|nr:aldo/keto reductase [Streptomyces sp. RLB3-6]QDN84416.1 aldo/keto reductase [Streptomyces sp. RLB3-6]